MPQTESIRSIKLGAIWNGTGTSFRLRSRSAESVKLCLFEDPEDHEADQTFTLKRQGDVWQIDLKGVGPGQLYGYRVDGPFAPEQGDRFNPSKLLVDPYASAITRQVPWHPDLSDYQEGQGIVRKTQDTAGRMPKCVVVDPRFDWRGDTSPKIPWHQTVIYECHVKGLTQLHPLIPPHLRGTYLALGHEPVIEHLRELGVTTLELMPVHHFVSEPHLMRHSLSNYWGYNTLGFFAPHADYATDDRGSQVIEFKRMIKALHQAGFEILLDVVYNHTAEGDSRGPTLCWRSIDNRNTYHPAADHPASYWNATGCGNTLSIHHPDVQEMVLDSMRYWVQEMHVDGFRFDLAPVLGRAPHDFDPEALFFERVRQDPILSKVKLIAEPWDVGHHGYRLGQFPEGWSEWNDRYRDTVRSFWRGDAGRIADLATRLAGSRDLFANRSSTTSINFVACHDGFTLEDLVSYEVKHNWANREGNRDGHHHNLSRNWGHEGPTEKPQVLEIRGRIKRNLLATLAFSWGIPMLGHGDELGRTQGGNNNAYCQDNSLTWIDWHLDTRQSRFLDYCRHLFHLRKRFRNLWNGAFPGDDTLTWLRPDGAEMSPGDWHNHQNRTLGLWIHPQDGDLNLLFFINGEGSRLAFHLPTFVPENAPWHLILDTATDRPISVVLSDTHLWLEPHTMTILESSSRDQDRLSSPGSHRDRSKTS